MTSPKSVCAGGYPNGAFSFISEALGGRTSDVHVMRESKFYDILEPSDQVMADHGFTIAEDLLLHSARLRIPPGKHGQEQFTKAKVKRPRQLAIYTFLLSKLLDA